MYEGLNSLCPRRLKEAAGLLVVRQIILSFAILSMSATLAAQEVPQQTLPGASLLLRRCHDCGRPIGAKDAFCPFCGTRQPRGVQTCR